MITAATPRPTGQQRRQHGAEDGEQDDQDRREAGALGLREVLLLELLHAGPQRLLADHVGLHAVGDLADLDLVAQIDGGLEDLVAGAGDGQREDDDRSVVRRRLGLGANCLAVATSCGVIST